ncbi:MAG: RNA-binding protein [Phycisphaerae bacterium SM23_33]|jgi:RNA recognition motif-containing protein|nr:MAG: RNA-binding protein [Phycisphaerae bacterium SM23_33]
MKRIYVGGLSYETTEEKLRELFAAHGSVEGVAIITDRTTGRSRGFGFVEMTDDNEATAAITELNGAQLDGRTLTVNEARPRPGRSFRSRDRRDEGGGSGDRGRRRW